MACRLSCVNATYSEGTVPQMALQRTVSGQHQADRIDLNIHLDILDFTYRYIVFFIELSDLFCLKSKD